MSDSSRPHGLYSLWNCLGQNNGVGSLSLLQGIFLTQGSNPGLPHCRQILYQLSHQGSPGQVRWSGIPISLRIFQFVVIHTGKRFSVVNKVNVFLEFSCFFYDPMDVGNLRSNCLQPYQMEIIIILGLHIITTHYQHCSMYDSLFHLFYLSLKTQGTP